MKLKFSTVLLAVGLMLAGCASSRSSREGIGGVRQPTSDTAGPNPGRE